MQTAVVQTLKLFVIILWMCIWCSRLNNTLWLQFSPPHYTLCIYAVYAAECSHNRQ